MFCSEFVGQYIDVPFGYVQGLRDGVLPMLIPLTPISKGVTAVPLLRSLSIQRILLTLDAMLDKVVPVPIQVEGTKAKHGHGTR